MKRDNFLIWSLLIIISFIPTFYLFYNGFVESGHDNQFHFAQIQDFYDNLKSGNFNYYINYEANHGFGMGVKLMYAPLSHVIPAMLKIVFPFISLLDGMKILIYITTLLSGVFSYKLMYRISGSKATSLFVSSLYILFPYRFSVIYIRNALAECVGMSFIPLVFLGVYDVINDKNTSIKPFLLIICGVSLIFLSHNITAFYTIVFVLIFIVFNIKKILPKFMVKRFYIYSLFSVLVVILLLSFWLIPLYEHYSLGIYRIFNESTMNSSLENIINESDRSFVFMYAGVDYNYSKVLGLFLIYLVIYLILKSFNKNKYVNLLIYVVCFIFVILGYILHYYILGVCCLICLISNLNIKDNYNKIVISEFSAFLFLFILTFVLCMSKFLWKFMPHIFYNIQFPWRLWTFVSLFGGISVGYVIMYIGKYKNEVGVIVSFILIPICIIFGSYSSNKYNINKDCDIDISDTYSIYSAGWQLEYFPRDFIEGKKSLFWWKCYNTMNNANDKMLLEISCTNARYSDYVYDKGDIYFDIEVYDESVVTLPRIYYLGYEVKLTTSSGDVYYYDTFNNSGLLGFKCSESGSVSVSYKGTKLMNMSKYFVSGGAILFIAGIIYSKKEKKLLN